MYDDFLMSHDGSRIEIDVACNGLILIHVVGMHFRVTPSRHAAMQPCSHAVTDFEISKAIP
jgi:hypothetical protein